MKLKAIALLTLQGCVMPIYQPVWALEVISLESAMNSTSSGYSQWDPDAFYAYSGHGSLRVLQVVSGVLGVGAGILVRSDATSAFDKNIFIKGMFANIADGENLPAVYVKVDGVYQYQNAIGVSATIRAFRKLNAEEESMLEEWSEKRKQERAEREKRIKEEAAAAKARDKAKRTELKQQITRRVEEIENAYFREQESVKEEMKRFFSNLEIDFEKNVYVDRSWIPFSPRIEVRNVNLDALREAQKHEDWTGCLRIAFEIAHNRTGRYENQAEFTFKSEYSKGVFEKLKNYDFVEKGDSRYAELFAAQEKNDWHSCLRIAAYILGERKIVEEYPSKEELNDIFELLLSLGFNSRIVFEKEGEACCREKMSISLSWLNAKSDLGVQPFDKGGKLLSVHHPPLYIATSEILKNRILGLGDLYAKLAEYRKEHPSSWGYDIPKEIKELYLPDRVSRLLGELHGEEISRTEFDTCIGEIQDIINKRVNKYLVPLRSASTRVTRQGYTIVSASEARKDKQEFSSLWKTILPKDSSSSKVKQNLSRLKQGMSNETLAKIHDKYSEVKCSELLKNFVEAVQDADAQGDNQSALEVVLNTYRKKFLTELSARMDNIINKDNGKVKLAKCPSCNGLKYIKDEMTCNQCNGQGNQEKVKLGLNGTSRRVVGKCTQCKGKGKTTKMKRCTTCNGMGRVREE